MAVGMIAAEANEDLDALGTEYFRAQLHIGDPGAAGTANPALETRRMAVTWANASGGTKSNSADVVWTNVAASEDYTHFSMWNDLETAVGFTGTIVATPVAATDTLTILAGDLQFSVNVMA